MSACTVEPLFIESPRAEKRMSTAPLEALDRLQCSDRVFEQLTNFFRQCLSRQLLIDIMQSTNCEAQRKNPFFQYQQISRMTDPIANRRTLIASGEKTSVYRGTFGSQRSVLGPNDFMKEQLSFCRHYLSSLVRVNLMGSANYEIKIQIVVAQY